MPKNFADLGQRSAPLQHAHCQGVAKLVPPAMRCVNPGALERVAHNRADAI
jgi:hypothetical protein